MQTPLQISGPDFHLTDAIKSEIKDRADKLDRLCARIISCHVGIEAPVHHHRRGGPFNVRIDLAVPGKELAATQRSSDNLPIAIREAFEAIHRQLKDYAHIKSRDVKHHEEQPHGRISRLYLGQGYGFISADDGREIYFHRNSVLEEVFERLQTGDEVTFVEEAGERGPQASTVRVRS